MRVTVGREGDIPPGSSLVVAADDHSIVVYNVDGDLVALDNRCAHKDNPVAEGVVRDGILTCPAHLWRFDVRTGRRVDSPGFAVACHPVSVEDGVVVVDVPDPEPRVSMREQLLEHARTWNREDGGAP